jgi:hypothetical protein
MLESNQGYQQDKEEGSYACLSSDSAYGSRTYAQISTLLYNLSFGPKGHFVRFYPVIY